MHLKRTGIGIDSGNDPMGALVLYSTGKYDRNGGEGRGAELRAWEAGFTGEKIVLQPMHGCLKTYNGQRVGIIFNYFYNNSTFRQEFIIEPGSDEIEVRLSGEWHEVEKYLKVHFGCESDGKIIGFADMPYGVTGKLPEGEEYPMQYFCGIRDEKQALVVYNESQYGCMCEDNTLSVSIIRCATFPAKCSDKGRFKTRYGIKIESLETENPMLRIFRTAFSNNIGLMSYASEYNVHKVLMPEWSLIDETDDRMLISCLKKAETSEDTVVRLFNPESKEQRCSLPKLKHMSIVREGNLLEETTQELQKNQELCFRPYELKTLVYSRKK